MDFGALPPEINSGRMYAGPGPGSMLAAATTWDGLAADLHSTAQSYQSVIAGLSSASWQGPASASMAAAAAAYVAWMNTTGAQAQQTANHIKAAVGAYETAFAMTVPPPVIAANRAQQAALVATNVLGQNTPAIMATEAHYAEMWAQDAAAMYGYAGSSAAASQVTPFTPPQPATDPAGSAGQAAAVAQAAGTSAGVTPVQTALSSLTAIPQALQKLAQPLGSTSSTSGLTSLSGLAAGVLQNTGSSTMSASSGIFLFGSVLSSASAANTLANPESPLGQILGMGALPAFQSAATTPAAPTGAATPETTLASEVEPAGSGAPGAVSAGMGRAASLGPMAVPRNWAAAVPAVNSSGAAPSATGAGAVPEGSAGMSPGMVGRMPLVHLAGRTAAGTGQPFTLPRPTVIPEQPVAG